MQVIFHTGAHCTDEERLLKCLLQNKEAFAKNRVSVPGPSKYRQLFKETFKAMHSADPSPEARDVLIDIILDEEISDRVILSDNFFFGSKKMAIGQGGIYPDAAPRIAKLRKLFPLDQVEVCMAIRNPATFLPTVMKNTSSQKFFDAMEGSDPRQLRWSDTILRIREAAPDVSLTIWCNEDTPVIWAQIICEMAGLEHGTKINGEFDLLRSIMSKEGMKRFNAYLDEHQGLTNVQMRRVIVAFLDKFALDDQVEVELDLPGWTDELVEELTDFYDEDVFRIQHIPGVQLIAP
jgi:hypothetical protein